MDVSQKMSFVSVMSAEYDMPLISNKLFLKYNPRIIGKDQPLMFRIIIHAFEGQGNVSTFKLDFLLQGIHLGVFMPSLRSFNILFALR